jgi:hypothetical protein
MGVAKEIKPLKLITIRELFGSDVENDNFS